jgi:hypothetical protein
MGVLSIWREPNNLDAHCDFRLISRLSTARLQ